jgi:starch-binding outer membrane protein SusE/F
MKKWTIQIFSLISIFNVLFLMSSCIDDEDLTGGGMAPPFGELNSDLSGSEFVLMQENEDENFVTLSWSEVDFNTAKPVKYTIELGFAGENFAEAAGIVTVEDITSYNVSVLELNAAMINLGVEPEETADVQMRVRAWVDFLTDPALSDPVAFKATPYLLMFPPIYIIGDAQGWDLNSAAELQSFSPGVYEGTARFQANGNFRFFEAPDWGAEQWGFSTFATGSIAGELNNAGDGDSNFRFAGITAEYKVTVNFNTLTISLEPLGPPPPPSIVFLIDPATVSFDLVPELESIAEGQTTYQGVVMLETNDKFRLFTAKSWDADKYDWSYFEGGQVDSRLMDSGDDQSNILFTGESGWFIVTVSIGDASITLEETSEPSQSLFIVGDGYVGGWDMAMALSLNGLGNNEFEAIGTFKAGKFRFFTEADWAADQYGYNYFASGSVDTELADGGDGDSNFSFVGTEGIYKITVSLADKTITMEPVSAPTLYLLGDDQGWSPASAVSLTWMEGGIYEGTADFTNGSIFRLFANNDPGAWDWAGEQWRYSSFADGTIDADLEDGGGADSNFRFAGTTGTYTIRVDLYDLVVELE